MTQFCNPLLNRAMPSQKTSSEVCPLPANLGAQLSGFAAEGVAVGVADLGLLAEQAQVGVGAEELLVQVAVLGLPEDGRLALVLRELVELARELALHDLELPLQVRYPRVLVLGAAAAAGCAACAGGGLLLPRLLVFGIFATARRCGGGSIFGVGIRGGARGGVVCAGRRSDDIRGAAAARSFSLVN
ncbi:uncharacterized protein ColSpa_10195 [Colletotrichum spaethianum]|uniref:Uncharacterized protein n=1 Tax=Colletotrichum spaethianum TaxID=700344 RepID=A0AA37PD06_9PEZI|nr:uncharacterized protein ColSpa_10195 [Colletotrichum spaethianum]GKT50015.1 hypothetical protein ColSpa_10195 [Colletotrichum spaethianum]